MSNSDVSLELRAINVKQKITVFQSLEFVGVSLLHGHTTQQILCPFHDDSKPSARVYSDSGKIFCFTCHKIWDCISVVMERRQISFGEAITLIEEHFKLQSPLENLPLTVRYNVQKTRSKEPSIHHLLRYTEDRLIAARHQLGLTKYIKYLTVIDITNFYLQTKKIDGAEFSDTLRKILAKLPANV